VSVSGAGEAPPASHPADDLFSFPCAFPLKIIGRADPDLTAAVLAVVQRHAPDFSGASMQVRASHAGSYLSLTCTINAVSRQQLDALYRELCAHALVRMVL